MMLFFAKLTPKVLERFNAKVVPEPNSGCWLWMAGSHYTGYGHFRLGSRMFKAHRIALAVKLGRDVEGQALHSCDNPACVNPDHLREGSQLDNMRDMRERGRGVNPSVVGTLNGRAKLSEADVLEIRTLAGTMSQRAIARRFDVSQPQVSSIVRRKRWADLL